MATAKINYIGDLKCEIEHIYSGTKMVTSAPLDNNGDASSFSPTDLLASAYVSCMITIIGIYCDQNKLEFNRCEASANKMMESGPRRVAKLEIDIDLEGNNWSPDEQARIIRAAEACPVAQSVSKEMIVDITYRF